MSLKAERSFRFKRYLRTCDALLDQHLSVKAPPKLRRSTILLSAIFRRQAKIIFSLSALYCFTLKKGYFASNILQTMRGVGAQRHIGFDLAAFFFEQPQ